MTADGTYTGPRAGETITAADQLDALPQETVVRGAEGQTYARYRIGWLACGRQHELDPTTEVSFPVTVLFRPSAPQPATTDDAVERAIEAADKVQDDIRGIVPLSSTVLRPMISAALAAAGAGTEVDREALYGVIFPAMAAAEERAREANAVYAHLDDLADAATDAVLAARGDAVTPTAPGPLTVKFDGGRRSVLDESNRIVGYLTGDVAPTVTAEQRRHIAADAVRLAHRLIGESSDPNPYVAMLDVADAIESGAVTPWREVS